MSQSTNVLLMCLSDPACDPRPYRNIHFFHELGYSVDTLSFRHSKCLPVRKSYCIPSPSSSLLHKLLRLGFEFLQGISVHMGSHGKRFSLSINQIKHSLSDLILSFDGDLYELIVVEDLHLLPLAFSINRNANILFDAREYYPLQNDSSIRFKVFEAPFRDFLLRRFANRCNCLITVSNGLRVAYQKFYSLDMQVITSAPPFQDLPVQPTFNRFRLVHHGAANKNRGLHKMIEIVRRLDDRYSLDLYLVGNQAYIDQLQLFIGNCNRIRLLPAVPFESIIPTLRNYDIGFYYLEPTNFNLRHCLPNKFFEFIQARLALAIGPSPEMSALVKKYGCGFVSQDFTIDSMVRTLSELTLNDIHASKVNSSKAAAELCFEKESTKLLSITKTLLH